jgi:hypothetical protein
VSSAALGEEQMESFTRGLVRDRRLTLLIVFAVLLTVLWLIFSVQPVHADATPQQIIPDPEENPSNRIQGWVWVYGSSCQPVSGINVYLDAINKTTGEEMAAGPVQTWSNGYFYFENSDPRFMDCIAPNQVCYISINGMRWDYGNGNVWETLGYQCDNPAWCQWRGKVTTDNRGYGCFCPIWLDRSSWVDVPISAIFSNTNYVQDISYWSESWHDDSFTVNGAGNGFMCRSTWSNTIGWGIQGVATQKWAKRYFAASYYDTSGCDIPNPGIVRSGISAQLPGEQYRGVVVQEYLPTPNANPLDPTHGEPGPCLTISLAGSSHVGGKYSETDSQTWFAGFQGSLGIQFVTFGFSMNIDVTVSKTSGHSSGLTFSILRTDPQTSPLHMFVLYTPATNNHNFENINPNDLNSTNNVAGYELHIWDAGVPQ